MAYVLLDGRPVAAGRADMEAIVIKWKSSPSPVAGMFAAMWVLMLAGMWYLG